jgi:hypothetical protein
VVVLGALPAPSAGLVVAAHQLDPLGAGLVVAAHQLDPLGALPFAHQLDMLGAGLVVAGQRRAAWPKQRFPSLAALIALAGIHHTYGY